MVHVNRQEQRLQTISVNSFVRKLIKYNLIPFNNISIIFRVNSKLHKIIKLGKDELEKGHMNDVIIVFFVKT